MSRLMALGACLLLVGACSTSEPSPMFARYIAAQEALADDARRRRAAKSVAAGNEPGKNGRPAKKR
ncbi:MAG: hypothetical protein VX670_06790, partial [Candidatus Latescibacterota bacterium]|nr:hypothetical protein [Candidatus Latescibacterota bacterium]